MNNFINKLKLANTDRDLELLAKERIEYLEKNTEETTIDIFNTSHKGYITSNSPIVAHFFYQPFYIDDLKYKTGNDEEVKSYVLGFDECKIFIQKLKD